MHLLLAVNWKVKGSSFHQSGMIWKFQLIPLILGKMSQMTSHHLPTIQMNKISDNLLNVNMNAQSGTHTSSSEVSKSVFAHRSS